MDNDSNLIAIKYKYRDGSLCVCVRVICVYMNSFVCFCARFYMYVRAINAVHLTAWSALNNTNIYL